MDTGGTDKERLVRVEERLRHVEKQLDEVLRRQNWALGIIIGAFILAFANWIIKGGLASAVAATMS